MNKKRYKGARYAHVKALILQCRKTLLQVKFSKVWPLNNKNIRLRSDKVLAKLKTLVKVLAPSRKN